MLVISRKTGESVVIGNSLVVISESRNGVVKLAIQAPADVKILRSELLTERKSADGESSA